MSPPRRSRLPGAFLAAALFLAAAAGAQVQEVPRPQGVTVPENRDLAILLADARRFLEEGDVRAAVVRLQRVLRAGPKEVVRARPDDLLWLGARESARRLLESLPPEDREVVERLAGAEADAALARALDPPDLDALRRVQTDFAGTAAADRARLALAELLADRGEWEALPPDVAPEELLGAPLPAETPPPESHIRTPSYRGMDDPALPLVRAAGAVRRWEYSFSDSPLPPAFTGHRVAVAGNVAWLSDSRRVRAVDLATGRPLWENPGPPGWDRLRGRDALQEAFEMDMVLGPVLAEGVLVVPIQEPVLLGRYEEFRDIPVRRFLPGRRLWALDPATGRVLWKQDVPWMHGDHPEPRELLAAAPAVAAGRVFVPVYDAVGTVDLSLLALDLHTGRRLWKTFLVSGQREATNLFGNVLRELAAGVPAADGRRVLLSSNLGAVSALDAATGAVLWTRLYERTPVRTFQTGVEGRREKFFANSPPAYDGRRFVCTPTDSALALALAADTGEVLAMWPSGTRVSPRSDLRHLVALFPWGALFNGVSVQLLTFPGQGGRRLATSRVWDEHSILHQRHAAALAEGEILVPGAEGVERFDPVSGRSLGLAFRWQRPEDPGSLQVAPGVLLVLRPGGVVAWTSPEALLEYLQRRAERPEDLARILPFLEGLRLPDRATALRVALVARQRAAATGGGEVAERLLLVAGAALIQAGRPEDAAASLGPVLDSQDLERRRRAALLVLDALERTAPASPLLGRALALLEAEGPPRLRRSDGRSEPRAAALARARYLVAAANGRAEDRWRALLDILRLRNAGDAREEGRPLQDWAAARLAALLEEHPELRERHEIAARDALDRAGDAVDEGLLRAFAGTAAVRNWLASRARSGRLDRAGLVRLAAWARDYGGGEELAALDAARLLAPPPLPALPPALNSLDVLDLGADLFLDARPTGAGSLEVLMQTGDREEVYLVDWAPGQTRVRWRQRLADSGQRVPYLVWRGMLHDGGATVVYGDLWVRLGDDGSRRTVLLPGSCDRPYRLGQMATCLCRDRDGRYRLQIRDLASAALFLDLDLPEGGGTRELVLDGRRILVAEAGSRRVLAVDPLARPALRELELPAPPTPTTLHGALPWAGGLAIPQVDRLLLALPDGPAERALPEGGEVQPFAAPGGLAWLVRPLALRSNQGRAPRLHWLPDRASRSLAGGPLSREVKAPQVDAYQIRRAQLPTPEVLLLAPDERGRTRVQAVRLGPGATPPVPAWTTTLQAPFRLLARRQPVPARFAGGWVLPLFVEEPGRGGAVLQLHRLDDAGHILDQWSTGAGRARPGAMRLIALPGHALLLADNLLHWLGKP